MSEIHIDTLVAHANALILILRSPDFNWINTSDT